MDSNITLKSNIYINKTASEEDRDFLQHITDYKILKLYNGNGSKSWVPSGWMTETQKAILQYGRPNCSLEHGTMSWGVPVGSDRFVCRCEEFNCAYFKERCSKYYNFEYIKRTLPQPEKKSEPIKKTAVLPLYNELDAAKSSEETEYSEKDLSFSHLSDAAFEKADPDIQNTAYDDASLSASETSIKKEMSESVLFSEAEDNEVTGFQFEEDDEVFSDFFEESEPEFDFAQEDRKKTVSESENEEKSCAVEIADQSSIIHADLSARIWVNAGPGTGKTYTVIQRLKKLLTEHTEGSILVLCFSRNAVQVIRERLAEELGFQADALMDEGQLIIKTFDSFATYMLEDELNTAWDYSQRIEEFIKMIANNAGALNDMVDYLIVDEIQDTVGVRARMLLSMLDELKCGVLLLGDACQAIFDWTVQDTQDMTFSELMTELKKRKFIRYELTENRRQTKELAYQGQELRNHMLSDNEKGQEEAIAAFKDWVRSKWCTYDMSALSQCLSGASELILCKTNGEAAHLSQFLFENAFHISHIMKRSQDHRTLSGWIAKVLYGNDGHILEKSVFLSNAENFEVEQPEEKWAALKSLDQHAHAPSLHIPELLHSLSQMDSLPDICLNRYKDSVIVSTVHRAKGSEAEHVYWLDSPLIYENQKEQKDALNDALKAAYVAATRAKTDVHMLNPDKKSYMKSVHVKSVQENRWIQIAFEHSIRPHCKGIAMIPEDVDLNSFADKEYAASGQATIAFLEPGLAVDLYSNVKDKCFDIYFDGQQIGKTSQTFTDAMFAGFNATKRKEEWPICIRNAFITEITTIISNSGDHIDEQYRTSGCWLGIELGGFPNLEWY